MTFPRPTSASCTAALLLAWSLGGIADRRPVAASHLIVISVDTLRADHLRHYGYHRRTSPALDRLAARSVRFARAVAHAPNTPPSQLSLLSSQYYGVHGFSGVAGAADPSVVTLAQLLGARGFTTWGFVDGGYMSAEFGFDRGFDHYDDAGGGIAAIVDRIVARLDGATAERFFLFVHCYDVHSPYGAPEPFRDAFVPRGSPASFEPTSDNLQAVVEGTRVLSDGELAYTVGRYDGGIRYTDGQLGQLLAALDVRDLLRRSVVVFTADHGEEFLEHGSMLHWQTWFTPNLHVPLLIGAPGQRAGVVTQTVEQVDVVPTVLELLALAPHDAAMGRSLVSLMRGEAIAARSAYAEPFNLRIPWRTVITDRHQLRLNLDDGAMQLFDLELDPLSRRDRAADDPEIAAALRGELVDRMRAIERARLAASAPQSSPILRDSVRRRLEELGYL
jgi:arylsulfatase A-like enzyme